MKPRPPTWTELTALVIAVTGLLNWWTEHKRATKAEKEVRQWEAYSYSNQYD